MVMAIQIAISSSHVMLYMLEVIGGHVWFVAQAGGENLGKQMYPGDCC